MKPTPSVNKDRVIPVGGPGRTARARVGPKRQRVCAAIGNALIDTEVGSPGGGLASLMAHRRACNGRGSHARARNVLLGTASVVRDCGACLAEARDPFAHPFGDEVRERVSVKPIDIRPQGGSGAAMLPMPEHESVGVTHRFARLQDAAAARLPNDLSH